MNRNLAGVFFIRVWLAVFCKHLRACFQHALKCLSPVGTGSYETAPQYPGIGVSKREAGMMSTIQCNQDTPWQTSKTKQYSSAAEAAA
jgi:hypothetical protein